MNTIELEHYNVWLSSQKALFQAIGLSKEQVEAIEKHCFNYAITTVHPNSENGKGIY